MKFTKSKTYGFNFESKWLTAWQEPTWMNEKRYWGLKVWEWGGEINLGKLMFRARLNVGEWKR